MTSNNINNSSNNVYVDLCNIIENYTTKQDADEQAERILQDILNDSDNPNCVDDAITKLKKEKPFLIIDHETELRIMFQQWLDKHLAETSEPFTEDFKIDLRNMFIKYMFPDKLVNKLVDTMLALPINDSNSIKKIMDIINETTQLTENTLTEIEKEVSTFFEPKNNPEQLQFDSSVSFHKISKKNNYSNDAKISSDELLTPLSHTEQITKCIDDIRNTINDEEFNKSIEEIVEQLKNNEPIKVEKERMKLSPHCIHLTETEPTPFELQQRIDKLEERIKGFETAKDKTIASNGIRSMTPHVILYLITIFLIFILRMTK